MKVLTVLTYYHPHWTGLTAHAVNLAEGLAARGHQITVVAARHHPQLARDEIRNGVRIVRLRPLFRYSRGVFLPAFPLVISRLMRGHDVVQIHTPLPEAPLVAAIARLIGRPLLMTHHGDLVMPRGFANRILEWAGLRLLRWAGNQADAVTSYSRDYSEHSQLLQPLRHKLSCIYPPVELPAADVAAARAWRAQLGLEGKVLLGFAGRWVEEKGYDDLLRALPEVRRAIPEAHLVFAGEVDVVYEDFAERCRPLLEAQREHVTLVGLVRDRQRLADFYAMLDLFVLPSRSDMMALGQVEALLAGTPVVATDIPGARVVIRETGFGQLAPARDPAGLARTLVETWRRRAEFEPSHERVRELFRADKAVAENEALLTRIAGREDQRSTASRRAGAAKLGIPAAADRRWDGLSTADHQHLDRFLRNEADMAYRRRVRVLLDYLRLRDGDRVLDAGCGFGLYLAAMSRLRDLKLVGLDRSSDRLARARSRSKAGLVAADSTGLPFADETFDAVLLSEVLEHVPDEALALAEILRVLKPGGRLAVSVPHANYPFWWDPIGRINAWLGGSPIRSGPLVGIWTNHERLYTPARLVGVAEDSGFEVEAVEESTHHCFPFSHLLVYGIGKPLLEHDLLPEVLARSADRFRGEESSGSLWNPVHLGVALLRACDRRNDRPGVENRKTFVNVLASLRKPTLADRRIGG